MVERSERERKREVERERELVRLERERAARKRVLQRFPLCCDCSGLVLFTMPCLLRILSSHCIYPQRDTTSRPTKYLTLFLVGFSTAAVGGEHEMEVMEKRKACEECDETRASHFIRSLFVGFQAAFLFKVSGATLFCERYLGYMSSEQVMVTGQQ